MAPARNVIIRWIFGEETPPLPNRAARRQQQRESRRRRHPSLTPSTQSQSHAPEPFNTLTRLIFGNQPAVLEFNDYRGPRIDPAHNIFPIVPQIIQFDARTGKPEASREQLPLALGWAMNNP